MTPLYTLLLCLPAALVLLACSCGLAGLGPRVVRPAAPRPLGRAGSARDEAPRQGPWDSKRRPTNTVATDTRKERKMFTCTHTRIMRPTAVLTVVLFVLAVVPLSTRGLGAPEVHASSVGGGGGGGPPPGPRVTVTWDSSALMVDIKGEAFAANTPFEMDVSSCHANQHQSFGGTADAQGGFEFQLPCDCNFRSTIIVSAHDSSGLDSASGTVHP